MTFPRRRRFPVALAGAALVAWLVAAGCGGSDAVADRDGSAGSTTAVSAAGTGTASSSPNPSPSQNPSPMTADEQRIDIVVRGGGVVGGPRTAKLRATAPVVLRVTSDIAEEIHLHGYDLVAKVAAGSTAELRFDPKIPGVFELEFHQSGKKLGELEIR